MKLGEPGTLRAVAMEPFNRDAAVKPTKTFFFKTSLLSFLLCWTMVAAVAEADTKVLTANSMSKPEVTVQTSTAATKNTGDRPSCPPGCFCDWNASLLSCSGPEDDDNEESHELEDEEDDDDNLSRNNKGIVVDNRKNITYSNERERNDYVWPAAASASVQRLDLRHLMVTRLDAVRLNGTDELLELSIVLCDLESIANGTFIRHGRLERLDLSQNRIAILTRVRRMNLLCTQSLSHNSDYLLQYRIVNCNKNTFILQCEIELNFEILIISGYADWIGAAS